MLWTIAFVFKAGKTVETDRIEISVALARIHTVINFVKTLQIGAANEDICTLDLINPYIRIDITDPLVVWIVENFSKEILLLYRMHPKF